MQNYLKLIGANRVPETERPKIIEIIKKNELSLNFSQSELTYLFEIYNEHIGIDTQYITCPACRSKVVSKMILFVKNWEL